MEKKLKMYTIINFLMAVSTLVKLRRVLKVSSTVQVLSNGQMVQNILEIGVKVEQKDVEFSSMLMEISLKVNS